MKKPITFQEAGPRPWRVMESRGGHLFIYANNETSPISIIRPKKRMTRREQAELRLICDAVNYVHRIGVSQWTLTKT